MVSKPIAWIVAAALAFGAACTSHDAKTSDAPKPASSPATGAEAAKPAATTPAPASTGSAPARATDSKPVETKPADNKPVETAPTTPPPEAAKPAATAPAPSSVTPRDEPKDWFITLERAKELYDKKDLNGRQVIFVDARTYVEFTDGHIRGAMCYSTKYTQGAPQAKLKNYLPGSAVVLYCRGELCQDSFDVGRYFQSLHLDIGPIFVIKDGFPGWEKAYPKLVDKGPEIGFD